MLPRQNPNCHSSFLTRGRAVSQRNHCKFVSSLQPPPAGCLSSSTFQKLKIVKLASAASVRTFDRFSGDSFYNSTSMHQHPVESYYNEIIAKPKIHFLCLNPFPLENIGTALKLGRNMIHVLGGLASGAVPYNHSTAIENFKTKVLCLYFLPAIHLTTSSVVAVC